MVFCLEFVFSLFEGSSTGREGPREPVPEVGVDLLGPLHVWAVASWSELNNA